MNTTPNPKVTDIICRLKKARICSSPSFLLLSSGDDYDKTLYCEMLKRKNELVINLGRLRAHTGK